MKRHTAVNLIRVLAGVVAFATVFSLGVRPSWWLMEKLWTRDVSSEQNVEDHRFSVLVRQTKESNRYAVDYYADLGGDSKLVTDFNNQDLDTINRDLRASISAESSHYVYFRVLRRGEGYTDVQLETPTTGDFWSKYSYRIKSGQAHLLRSMGFGPLFGLTVAILPLLAGVVAILCCDRLLRTLARRLHS